MALTATGYIFVDESLPATDSNPTFRNPDLAVDYSVGANNDVNATLFVLNTDGAIIRGASFLILEATIDAVTLTTSTTSDKMREAVEKCVRDRLNTLNGSTVITWS